MKFQADEVSIKQAVEMAINAMQLEFGEREIILDNGKKVRIEVYSASDNEVEKTNASSMTRKELLDSLNNLTGNSMKGSVLKDANPNEPAVDPNDWGANQ